MLEKIPFLHRGNAYYIIIEDDITFTALHALLDELLAQGAFNVPDDCALQYRITCEGASYSVGVDGVNVIIAVD